MYIHIYHSMIYVHLHFFVYQSGLKCLSCVCFSDAYVVTQNYKDTRWWRARAGIKIMAWGVRARVRTRKTKSRRGWKSVESAGVGKRHGEFRDGLWSIQHGKTTVDIRMKIASYTEWCI